MGRRDVGLVAPRARRGADPWSRRWRVALARDVGRDDDPVACRAIGFPSATERGASNNTHDLSGEIRPAGGVRSGLLWVDVRTSPPVDATRWAGVSGAALFCGEVLVGLIESYPIEFGGKVLKAVRVERLVADETFLAALRLGSARPTLEPVSRPAGLLPGLCHGPLAYAAAREGSVECVSRRP